MCHTHTYQWLMPHIRNELIPQVCHSWSMQVGHTSLILMLWQVGASETWLSLCVCHDLFYANWYDVWHVDARVTSPSSNLWHDSFICVTWLISYECCGSFMWYDSLIRMTWLTSYVWMSHVAGASTFQTPRPLTQTNESWHTHQGNHV